MEKETLGVLIGRFQLGPHKMHMELIAQAASKVDRLMILIGSANQRLSPKNPFPYSTTSARVIAACWEAGVDNVIVEPINDYRYNNDVWADGVRLTVVSRAASTSKVILFGFHKDESSFYLDIFPEWEQVELVSLNPEMSSTYVRKFWFEEMQTLSNGMVKHLPSAVKASLSSHEFDTNLQSEYDYYQNEKKKFIEGYEEKKPDGTLVVHKPYPYVETLNFCCGDVVLECAGHIALGKRKNAPGKDCWAVAGGFKNYNETYLQCALRELREEFNPKLTDRILLKSIVATKIFDDPGRSQGIPRNTLAVHIKVDLNPDGTLPKLKGGDDIDEESVRWVPIREAIENYQMFDDHKDIISYFTGIYQTYACMKGNYVES